MAKRRPRPAHPLRDSVRSSSSQTAQGGTLFEAALLALADPFLVVDSTGTLLFFNDAFVEFLRFRSRDQVPRRLVDFSRQFEVFEVDGRPITFEQWPIMRAFRGEVVRLAEMILRRKDSGERWWGRGSYSAVRRADGSVLGVCGMIRDVTPIKKFEMDLQEVSQRLQLATTSAKLGVWDWDVENDVMFWDDRMLELYGVTREQLREGVRVWQEGLHPEDRDRAIGEVQAALRGEKEFDTEFRVLKTDGRIVHIKANGLVVRRADGSAARMTGVNADVTVQKEAESALRHAYAEIEARVQERTAELQAQRAKLLESEARLKRAQAIAHVGDFELDVESGRLAWSDELFRIWGMDPRGKAPTVADIAELVLPQYRDEFHRVVDEGIRLGKSWELTYRHRRRDGTIATNHTLGHATRDARGVVIRLNGVVQDVTREENLKQELAAALDAAEAANRSKDLFLATLSHELKSPLTAILLWSQMLQRGGLSPERMQTAVRTIQDNAVSQNQLINDLLDVSRIISGKISIQPVRLSLNESLRRTLDTVRPSAETKGLKIDERIPGEAIPVRGDPVRLKQIFWNLLTNAIKFTPAGGSIRVSLEQQAGPRGGIARVTFTDTGEGIRPEFLPKLFTPFWQADSSSQRVHGGLGLGLSIVRHLAQLHEGTVEARSDGPGMGATFTVNFPLAREEEQSAPHPDDAPQVCPQKPTKSH